MVSTVIQPQHLVQEVAHESYLGYDSVTEPFLEFRGPLITGDAVNCIDEFGSLCRGVSACHSGARGSGSRNGVLPVCSRRVWEQCTKLPSVQQRQQWHGSRLLTHCLITMTQTFRSTLASSSWMTVVIRGKGLGHLPR